jgi:hypothetical protein
MGGFESFAERIDAKKIAHEVRVSLITLVSDFVLQQSD